MKHRSEADAMGNLRLKRKRWQLTWLQLGRTVRNYFIYCISSWRFATERILTRKCPRKPRDEKMKKDKTRSEREIIYKIDMLHHVPWILMQCLRTFMSSRERVLEILELLHLVISLVPSSCNYFPSDCQFVLLTSSQFNLAMWCDFWIVGHNASDQLIKSSRKTRHLDSSLSWLMEISSMIR